MTFEGGRSKRSPVFVFSPSAKILSGQSVICPKVIVNNLPYSNDMTEEQITDEISEYVNSGDDTRLDSFIETLSPEDLAKHKTTLASGYYEIYSVWFYDHLCGKVEMSSVDSFFGSLLEMLDKAENLDPDVQYREDRARCYEALADELTDPQAKQAALDKAIEVYEQALLTGPPEVNALLARVLLDRILLTQRFSDENLDEISRRLRLALATYTETAVETSLHIAFALAYSPLPESDRWYQALWNTVTALVTPLAAREPLVYLTWTDTIVRALDRGENAAAPKHAKAWADQANALLDNITDVVTENTEQLNQLGHAFEKAALRVDGFEQQLRYYTIALQYFSKGHTINPAAWTFPVYATNALTAMARLYAQNGEHEKVIHAFETGLPLFTGVVDSDDDFTLNIYWAEFLIEYARLGFNFQAPAILKEAQQKALRAKELGQGFYDHPYIALAKITLKAGDPETCLSILMECREVFTTEYSTYSWDHITSDEDFREIWMRLP